MDTHDALSPLGVIQSKAVSEMWKIIQPVCMAVRISLTGFCDNYGDEE